jgi:hypothetical protein
MAILTLFYFQIKGSCCKSPVNFPISDFLNQKEHTGKEIRLQNVELFCKDVTSKVHYMYYIYDANIIYGRFMKKASFNIRYLHLSQNGDINKESLII